MYVCMPVLDKNCHLDNFACLSTGLFIQLPAQAARVLVLLLWFNADSSCVVKILFVCVFYE